MLFNSYIFVLLFLPLCLAGYFLLNRFKKYNLALVFLLGMSLWFYGYFNPLYLIIIVSSVLLNYCIYRGMDKCRGKKSCKALMIGGILLNLGVLGYFKYTNFLISNINSLFSTDFNLLHIVLPLGISFFTFQQISFIVDAYRGEIPGYDLLHYACFVTYFPQLIAGPIVTHDELVPQFMDLKKKTFNPDNLAAGIYIFTIGLAKKKLLADNFGDLVAYGFTTLNNLTSVTAFLTMLAYTLQIYLDFSGYCDMAIGIGKMFNLELPINFDSPYKALTITEFWDRWHMTLTRFFTKYVYIPLGGNRKGKLRTYINIMIVFLASGLWHGASWTFVFWGAIHGIFCVITRIFRKFFEKLNPVLNWFITFSFVNIAWVFFRAESFSQATQLIKTMFSWNFAPIDPVFIEIFRHEELKKVLSFFHIETYYPPFLITAFFLISMIIILSRRNSYERMKEFKPKAFNMLTTLFLLLWSVFSFAGMSTFLYFNF